MVERISARVLIAIDTDNLVYPFTSIRELTDSLEWQDVKDHEYDVIDESGRVYEFVVDEQGYDLFPTDTIDPSLPVAFLNRFRNTCGMPDLVSYTPLDTCEDWKQVIEGITDETYRIKGRRKAMKKRILLQQARGCFAWPTIIVAMVVAMICYLSWKV